MNNLINKLVALSSFDNESTSKATLEPFMSLRSDNDPLVMNLNFVKRTYVQDPSILDGQSRQKSVYTSLFGGVK